LNFPTLTHSASSRSYLYAIAFNISIYSSHISRVVENSAIFMFRSGGAGGRTNSDILARQTAMYLANVAFGLSFTEISKLFGRDRTTVTHACAVIEDLRDNVAVDRALTILEAALTASPCTILPSQN
jgi:hypothetical protein